MKTTTIVLVMLALIGMAVPVFGASAGSDAGASANWDWASQYTTAWAGNGYEYAEVGSTGNAEGVTYSSSGAAADDYNAYGETYGESESDGSGYADSFSFGLAQENDPNGNTETGAGSYAEGDDAQAGSDSESFWGPPIYSYSDAFGAANGGYAESGAYANAHLY